MTRHLLFDVAGLNLAVPAVLIKAIHEKLDVQPVAGTKRWFAGLAVASGKLLPVTDLGVFSGRRSSTGRTLELDPSAAIAGLRVDRIVGLSDNATQEDVSNQDADSGKENERSVSPMLAFTGMTVVQGNLSYQCVDVTALVQSAVFLNIAESEV